MAIVHSLIAFAAAATLLTITPGPDTALVLRVTTANGWRAALLTGLGICAGCLFWGIVVAIGLGALIIASSAAYAVVKLIGAAYLVWLGATLLMGPKTTQQPQAATARMFGARAFRQGLLTNALNPKIGIFYVSFLPQFIPAGTDVPTMTIAMASIHSLLGLVWFSVLISATEPLARAMKSRDVVIWVDRITGGVLVVLGISLACSS